ncbi:MAG TPA: DUF5715 family protein [Thermoanaerobaculia bacterium]|nr:DUF5715 family protein [Thermoanaerobaculia bacterium]
MSTDRLSRVGVLLASLALSSTALWGASLTPSRAGLLRQSQEAQRHGYTYLATLDQVHQYVRQGYLVRLPGNRDYAIANWVHPYARPEVKLFVERLGAQYRQATGEKLVVTSLVRPQDRQPPNSHVLSVHPTGMAMDLRVPRSPRGRQWLEQALLGLEGRGVLEAARERRPPHYHVVLFPRQYADYVAGKTGSPVPRGEVAVSPDAGRYRVRPGDSLWTIARAHRLSVASLQRANGLASSRIHPGKTLVIPAGGVVTAFAGGGATYRVRPGDNLWLIARRHGTSVAALKASNGLRTHHIKPGQTLSVPAR